MRRYLRWREALAALERTSSGWESLVFYSSPLESEMTKTVELDERGKNNGGGDVQQLTPLNGFDERTSAISSATVRYVRFVAQARRGVPLS